MRISCVSVCCLECYRCAGWRTKEEKGNWGKCSKDEGPDRRGKVEQRKKGAWSTVWNRKTEAKDAGGKKMWNYVI